MACGGPPEPGGGGPGLTIADALGNEDEGGADEEKGGGGCPKGGGGLKPPELTMDVGSPTGRLICRFCIPSATLLGL